jgi:glycosyltransferase involved in cell wall biosynthesis
MALNVSMISYEFPPYVLGGLGTYTDGLVSELKKICNLTLFLPFEKRITGMHTISGGLSKPEIEMIKKKYNTRTVIKYNKNIVEKFNAADVVNVHDWVTASAGVNIKKKFYTPLIHTVHSTQRGRPSKKRYPLKMKIEKKCFEQADRIITISNHMKKELIKHYKVDPKKIRIIYNCVDIKKFKKGSDKNYILFVGRFSTRKGSDYLVKAMPAVKKKFPDTKLIMIGTGETLNYCKQLAEKLDVKDVIKFQGYITEKQLINTYSHASVIALPSTYEPFGLTVLEGMASAKSVITTDISGASEIITNWKNGVITKTKNTTSLGNAIIKLLENDTLRKSIGKNAYKLARQYTWKKAAKQTLDVFKEVVY